MKKILCLMVLLGCFNTLHAQSTLFPKFLRRMLFEKDSSRRSSIIPLPVLSIAPETGVEAGGSVLYSFYTDTLNRRTRVSNVFAYGTLTTKGQSRINLSTSYWVPDNTYHYTASIGYINFPVDFYGVGGDTKKADAERISQKRFRLNVAGEKRFGDYIYVGFVAGGYNYTFGSTGNGIFEHDPAVQDQDGGALVYAGPSFIFDSRNNNTYTTKGILLTSNFSFNQGILANNNYRGGILSVEYSQYISLAKRLVLGIDIYDNSLIGGQSPFYLMPEMGSDELMRGYYNGRYRDRNYAASQAELRYRLSDRFGVVGFAGTGTVFHDAQSFNNFKPNYGCGLRYFFDVEKGLSIRMDYGIGEKLPNESRQSGFYIGLGEAF